MYDMYPEWGPARREPEHPAQPTVPERPVQESLDRRDNGGPRPDDSRAG